MAEGILQAMFRDHPAVNISSAGTHAVEGNPATEFAMITASEQGIDLSGHRARVLTRDLIHESTIILCMEPLHVEWVLAMNRSADGKVFNLAEFSGKENPLTYIFDPYGASIREYRECFRTISGCLSGFKGSRRQRL